MRDESFITLQGFDSFELRLGDELRGERASLGKSLLDVQRELKIKAAYIDAIENCDASVFPNPGFVAGYVRSYSRYLNLDADLIYRRFCEESGFEGVNSDLGVGRPNQKTDPRAPTRIRADEFLQKSRFMRPAHPDLSMAALSGLGSVLVLVALVLGLGYGGWYLLKDIQRIGFAPVSQVPEVLREPEPLPGLAAVQDPTAGPGPDSTTRDLALNEFYAPRLAAPDVEPRDGPIAAIDPDRSGLFPPETGPVAAAAATPPDPVLAEIASAVVASAAASELSATAPVPGLAGPPAPPRGVSIVTSDLAWVRIYLADGAIIFEKTLQPGESYDVPGDLAAPLLRAGNSGSVYVRVGDVTYGPLGKGTGVARNISLVANDVLASWPRAAVEIGVATTERNAALPGVPAPGN